MTFIPPKTFAVGEVLSAVDMNVFVRDNTVDLDDRLNTGTRFRGRETFQTPGTFTFNADDPRDDGKKPRLYRVICVGGGGGGGGGRSTSAGQVCAASGGNSGGFSERIYGATLSGMCTVVVGAGGIGGTGANGSDGEESSFEPPESVETRAVGGRGGLVPVSSSAPPSISQAFRTAGEGVGFLRSPGDVGSNAAVLAADFGLPVGGNGGAGIFGSPGTGQSATISAAQSDGRGFGGGGGGRSVTGANASAAKGGDGASGLVIVELFY